MDRLGKYIALFALAGLMALAGCSKENTEPEPVKDLTYLDAPAPDGFPKMQIPADNPLSSEGVALGRQLYYDQRLSQGGPLQGNSCSSCHIQAHGFAMEGAVGVPPIPHVNLAWSQHFLWNGKVSGTLEEIMTFEVKDFFQTDLNLMNSIPEYQTAFKKVYGVTSFNHVHLAKAMSQFFRTQNSYNSRYDQWRRGEATFTDLELRGYNLFFSEEGDCFHCHAGPTFSDGLFHNIGLDSISAVNSGREGITGKTYDRGLFKTPTLRNAAVRYPYMHDGRFNTLADVIEFYDHGMVENANLDPIFTKYNSVQRLELSEYDKFALLKFLESLTDEQFLNDSTLSAP